MKLVATRTRINWGHIEGDVLEYIRVASTTMYMVRNITRPELTADRCNHSYVYKDECRVYDEMEDELPEVKYEVKSVVEQKFKFLGITIFKKVTKEMAKTEG